MKNKSILDLRSKAVNLTKGTNLDLLMFEYFKYEIISEAYYRDPDGDYFNLYIEVPEHEKEQLLLDYLKFLNERNATTMVVGYKNKLPFDTKNIVLINTGYDIFLCKDLLHYNPFCICIFYDYNSFTLDRNFRNNFHAVMEPLTVIRMD